MKNHSLVSIIMPSYNTSEYIGESIKSVQAQTYMDWELIIIDDCSTDKTMEVVERFREDSRILFFQNSKNIGAALSRNKAIKMSRGRWIAFLDSDDLWVPTKLEKQIQFMEKNGIYFSYTNYIEMDCKGELTGILVSGPKKINYFWMENYCWVGCLTVMYDSNFIGVLQIGDISKNNDYAMWLQVSKKALCYLYPEITAKYRRGRKGSTSTHGYITLAKWHYILWHNIEKKNILISIINTLRNLCFGAIKKLLYVRTLN